MTIICTDEYFEKYQDRYRVEVESCNEMNSDEHEKTEGFISATIFVEDCE